ncbi:MAG: NlpC/P60 family protein [Paludibacteraceae bacterium]
MLWGQKTTVEEIIIQIGNAYAPDKRVILYEVEVADSSVSVVLKGKISDERVYEKIIRTISDKNIEVIDSIQLLPESVFSEAYWGVAPLSTVYVYREPTFSSEIVTQALLGTPIRFLDKKRGWNRIQTPDGYIGWVNITIQNFSVEELNRYNRKNKVIVTDLKALIYKNPTEKSTLVMEVLMGNILTLESAKIRGKFTKVSFPDGKIGFISSKSIQPLAERPENIQLTGESVLDTAQKFLGLPYFWGGTSVRGMDCSGLTKFVYFMHGLILPRDASQQYLMGDEVDISDGLSRLQKGDLLFFGTKSKSNPNKYNASHVAIYMGDSKFIHSSGQVRINSFNSADANFDQYNFNRFIGARRVIGVVLDENYKLAENTWYR